MKTVFLDRLLHCQDWLLLFVLHHHFCCSFPANLSCLSYHQSNQLPMKADFLVGKERLVVNHRSGVV